MKKFIYAFVIFTSIITLFGGCGRTQKEVENLITYIPEGTKKIQDDSTVSSIEKDIQYFVLQYEKQGTNVVSCTEEEFIGCYQRKTNPVIKAVINYFDNGRFTAVFKWMPPPEPKEIKFQICNALDDTEPAFLRCESSCRGLSDLADLTHIYVNQKIYQTGENALTNPIAEIINKDSQGVTYTVDLSKVAVCPYYTEPAISRGMFQKHTVSWKKINFTCSGCFANAAERLSVRICL